MTKLTDYLEQQQGIDGKPLNKYVVKLLWRVLSKIDPEKSELTFSDKEALEDALTCDSVADIAKRQHISEDYFRSKVNDALKAVTRQIDRWGRVEKENIKLKIENDNLKSTVRSQKRRIEILEARLKNNKSGKKLVEEEQLEPEPVPTPKESRYNPEAIPVSEELNQKLTMQLASLALPKDIITTLQRQGIFTVFDLVGLSESEYEDIYGLSGSNETILRSCIINLGLQLYMPVFWSNKRKKYMM